MVFIENSRDFYAAGDICFIGTGLKYLPSILLTKRTNMEAVYSLFDLNALGTRYVAVVKDAFDQNILRKDLHSVLSVVGINDIV